MSLSVLQTFNFFAGRAVFLPSLRGGEGEQNLGCGRSPRWVHRCNRWLVFDYGLPALGNSNHETDRYAHRTLLRRPCFRRVAADDRRGLVEDQTRRAAVDFTGWHLVRGRRCDLGRSEGR